MRRPLCLLLAAFAAGCVSADKTTAKDDASMRADLSKRSNPKDLPADVQAKMNGLSQGGK